jgi:erythromycin esterase-like protein/predicted phosphoribosyltransferase
MRPSVRGTVLAEHARTEEVPVRYRNRRHAGQVLAEVLAHYAGRDDVTVLALPRGGVPVAYEVARKINAPLDVLIVRKLGVPGYDELAMGAIASGGIRVVNDRVVRQLHIPSDVIDKVARAEAIELQRREQAYRGDRVAAEVAQHTVILVDDGLATGATMRAAVGALRRRDAKHVVVAVPIGSADTCAEMGAVADEVVCASEPVDLGSVGVWYHDFEQTTDEEVRELLAELSPETPAAERATTLEIPAIGGRNGQPRAGTVPGQPRARRNTAAMLVDAIAQTALPLTGARDDLDPLIELVGDNRIVMIGESTHGTHDFYKLRAEITKRLIRERGFTAVAAEADWPDAYRVNRYVRGAGVDHDATEALGDFRRFPQWMWRNADVLDFVGWLRSHNDAREARRRIGFYGLDLYSLHASIDAVLSHLDRVDPPAAARARARYACFEHFGDDPQRYGQVTSFGLREDCERDVVQQLRDLQAARAERLRKSGLLADDEHFAAEQNARVVANAEAYYRTMFRGHVASWNLRDTHMAETLDALLGHLDSRDARSKIVVWAHNSHVGDASATQMGELGEHTLGQLARRHHPGDTLLVGLTTSRGTVTAASDWDEPAERKQVRPPLPESYEHLFHEAGVPRFFLPMRELGEAAGGLREPRLYRAIGVVYRPDTERISHYLRTRLPSQFDAVIHIDETRALEPLERTAGWDRGEVPDTFPSGV